MNIYLKTISLMVVISLLGCENLLEPEPVGQVVIENVYKDKAGVITAINGAYRAVASSYGGRAIFQMTDIAGDDGWVSRQEDDFKIFITDETNTEIDEIWRRHFRGIARANSVLERAPEVDFPDDPELKEYILGQAQFLRGLLYFDLVRLFGGVPLFTEEVQNTEEASIPRSSIEEVYSQIETDLNEASDKLLLKSELDGSQGRELGRATKGAAKAILAKIYLTLERWQEAASTAKEVMDSGEYALYESDNYGLNFQGNDENGQESIFEIQFSSESGAIGANHNSLLGPSELVQGNGRQFEMPTNDTLDVGFPGVKPNGIVQAFEDEDIRKDVAMSNYDLPSFFFPQSGGLRIPLINKYFHGDASPSGNSPVNFPKMRYAELLLIRAEALNEMEAGNSDAIDIINNEIRARAGLGPLPSSVTLDQDAFRNAIWKERRVELCFEGKRFFDLNRTARIDEIMAAQGIQIDPATISEHPITGKPQYLYAIPLAEITANANMTQNPGY